MERLVSSEFYGILSRISDQNFDPDHIFGVFREEMPKFAEQHGMVLLKASIYEPVKRSREMKVIKEAEHAKELLNGGRIMEPCYVKYNELIECMMSRDDIIIADVNKYNVDDVMRRWTEAVFR